jgi:hypothetical protein
LVLRDSKLDELNQEEESSIVEDISALLASAQSLLMPLEEGEGFSRQYHDALKRSHDVVLEHAAARALLRQSVPNKG